MTKILLSILMMTGIVFGSAKMAQSETSLVMHGVPRYQEDFSHFTYANPNAVQGGHLRIPALGTFNSLNPFLVRGIPANGLGLVYQSLLSRARDEPFSLYGNVAVSFKIAPDRSWISYTLDNRAQFSDGSAVTVQDILFSYETLRKKGRPNHRQYYKNVKSVDIQSPAIIRFTFLKDAGREMPLILSLMPILSKKYFESVPFSETSLRPPLGTGPYRITSLEAGRHITYTKIPNFWGENRAQYRGRYNFNKISFEYFRDQDVAFEAFLRQDVDVFFESNPVKWVAKNRLSAKPIIQTAIDRKLPAPMRALAFNTRKEIFKDRNVRRAIDLAYDFGWVNKNLLHGLYKRNSSFFQNSSLAAAGLPTEAELDLLQPFRSELPRKLFTAPYIQPKSNGSGRNRKRLTAAKLLLEEAGWELSKGKLRHRKHTDPFTFEILLTDRKNIKFLSAFQKNLQKLGIEAHLRLIDSAGYQNRIGTYDFDMIFAKWGQSLSPGNEQAFYWSSAAGKAPRSRNYPGINLKSVDFLVERIAKAVSRKDLETATQALDRVLLWQHYVIPLHYNNQQWLYHWPHIKLPAHPSNHGTGLDVWWTSPIDAAPQKTQ